MTTKSFLLAAAFAAASLAGTALAQPAPDQQPPPGYGGPPPGGDQGPPPGYSGPPPGGDQGPPPGYGGPPPGGDQGPPPGYNSGPPPGYTGGPPPGGSMAGPARHSLRDRFAAANITGDGRLTVQQAQAGGMRGIAAHFAQIDRDNKGYVTMQDIHAWYASRRGAPGGGMQGPPPGQPQ